ncbi:hypothetical protein A2U01_0031245, partial [Trifolium medium]|nr:hypothetical protein [Trifolium medium]
GGGVATTGGRSHHQPLVLHRDGLETVRRKVTSLTLGEMRVESVC